MCQKNGVLSRQRIVLCYLFVSSRSANGRRLSAEAYSRETRIGLTPLGWLNVANRRLTLNEKSNPLSRSSQTELQKTKVRSHSESCGSSTILGPGKERRGRSAPSVRSLPSSSL